MRTLVQNLFINKVIWYLTASDVFTWSLFAVVNGFTGIYLATKIDTDIVRTVGTGLALFTITRALLQIPIGYITDKIKSDRDEIILLMIGNIFIGIPYMILPFVRTEGLYFVTQIILGFGTALNLIAWRKLFATNLDKDREGMEYGVYDTTISIATAIFGALTGLIAGVSEYYFDLVIFVIGFIMTNSWIWGALVLIHKKRQTEQNENLHRY